MGISDRDYARNDQPGFRLGGDRSMVWNLIFLTVGVYLLQVLFDPSTPGDRTLTGFLALHRKVFSRELLTHPWWILQPVTYGFVHARNDILHVFWNMLFLWWFGRDIEARYGKREFLAIYLTGIILSGLTWLVSEAVTDFAAYGALVGASGGVSTILMMYILLFPRRKILLYFLIPLPMWLFGIFWIVGDIYGAVERTGTVAYTAHLGGAVYGFIYLRTGWNLSRLIPQGFSLKKAIKPRPRLRVHEPEEVEDQIDRQVDEILRKIREEGQDSLTAKERQVLEQASRRYQQKHR